MEAQIEKAVKSVISGGVGQLEVVFTRQISCTCFKAFSFVIYRHCRLLNNDNENYQQLFFFNLELKFTAHA